MKQVTQRPRSGAIAVVEVPQPTLRPGWLLVANRYSVISTGTERSKVELGRKSLLQKARTRPDLVRKVVARAQAEGIRSTVRVVRDRLDALTPMGYSCAGVVIAVGAGVDGFAPGDHVACGGEWASHAEVVSVPRNLVAKVPPEVELADAAYATLGSIALHGVRQSEAAVGERVGVIGLGLVGQLASQILSAAGCDVFGIDVDPAAVELARQSGVRAFVRTEAALEPAIAAATDGLGLDTLLICAASGSTDPLELSAHLARDRGRLVVVGDVRIAVDRAALYDKELELRISRSYGPGRYDADYEQKGHDLPAGYVRWTEQRNLQAFIDLVAVGRIRPGLLTTHRFAVDDAAEAYALVADKEASPRPFGILLEYRERPSPAAPPALTGQRRPEGTVRVGLIGAGSFARGTILPALRSSSCTLAAVATGSGVTAADVALRFGFERAASVDEILVDESINAVIVATRHTSHARIAAAALRAGKAVLVEKPLGLTAEEIDDVELALAGGGLLMVGFNRRFAPLTKQLVRAFDGVPERTLLARVNAGALPPDHWLNVADEGGGRLVGEGCHFVDLIMHLAQAPLAGVHAAAIAQPGRPIETSDSFVATLRFGDSAVGTIVYSGGGDARLPKERVELMAGGMAAVLDDFRQLELYRGGKREVTRAAQDKGHRAQTERFVAAASGRAEAPSAASYLEASRATLALVEALRTGLPVEMAR